MTAKVKIMEGLVKLGEIDAMRNIDYPKAFSDLNCQGFVTIYFNCGDDFADLSVDDAVKLRDFLTFHIEIGSEYGYVEPTIKKTLNNLKPDEN